MRPTTYFIGLTGIIEKISPMQNQCCNQMISVRTMNGTINFILSPGTYVVDNAPLRTGMRITVFYDANLPIPLIYPPQYQACFISRTEPGETIMASYFDKNLLSRENPLKLTPDSGTRITTANGQPFTCELGEHFLLVYYRATTRSIPPQTTPDRIIVFC